MMLAVVIMWHCFSPSSSLIHVFFLGFR